MIFYLVSAKVFKYTLYTWLISYSWLISGDLGLVTVYYHNWGLFSCLDYQGITALIFKHDCHQALSGRLLYHQEILQGKLGSTYSWDPKFIFSGLYDDTMSMEDVLPKKPLYHEIESHVQGQKLWCMTSIAIVALVASGLVVYKLKYQ
jgi:hypothetical protein